MNRTARMASAARISTPQVKVTGVSSRPPTGAGAALVCLLMALAPVLGVVHRVVVNFVVVLHGALGLPAHHAEHGERQHEAAVERVLEGFGLGRDGAFGQPLMAEL